MVQLRDPATLEALAQLRHTLDTREQANRISEDYYTGKIKVENLRIAIPAELENIAVVSDWPTTIVDAYHERMIFRGWRDNDRFNMKDLFTLSGTHAAVWQAIQDSYIYGVGFTAWEPDAQDGLWRVRAVSPREGTLIWDAQTERPVYGYRRRTLADGNQQEVLYTPGYNIYLAYDPMRPAGDYPEVDDVVPTGMPVPVMDRVRNQLKSNRWYGRSMLTNAVRYYTQAAARTLLGMEYNREFYTAPKWWVTNAYAEQLAGKDNPSDRERTMAGWKATTGSVLTLPPPEDEEREMKVGQFTANPPTPYVEQLRTYSQLLASATGIPSAYLGFSTENPPSGDAIRAWQERLTRGCSSQQRLISNDMRSIGWKAYALNSGDTPTWAQYAPLVREVWDSPATVTLSSDADAISKLISSGAVGPQTDWVYDRLQVSEEERAALRKASRLAAQEALARKNQDNPTVNALANQGGGPAAEVMDVADLKSRADALGIFIRAGVDPADAAARLGLEGIKFTGAVPGSLRQPESVTDRLEER